VSVVIDLECAADEVAEWAARAPLTEGVLTPFGVVDPDRLSQDGCLNLLIGLERLGAWVAAQQARVLNRLAERPDPVPAPRGQREFAAHEYVREEISAALRWSDGQTGERMQTATVLSSRLTATLDMLEDGSISYVHARALAGSVRDLDQSVTAEVEVRVLRRAAQQTPAEFRRAVRRAVATLDPRGAEERHEAVADERRVAYEPADDAMAWINAFLPAADAQTVMTAVQAVADKARAADPDDARTADQLRADALTAICAAALNGGRVDGLPMWQGRRPNVNVCVALSTLLGFDEQPGDLDGYGPVPATVARRMAADPSGTWRRLVTDERGHLLDYGRTTYRPPADLREYVIARDRTCRGIGCHRQARRCELDHVHDWDDGGQTDAGNLAPECRRDHHLKHDAGWTVRRRADGTVEWTSPAGRAYEKPPETYPVDHTRPPKKPAADPPPF
jgi:hypothetical protein